jgi:hypothetical protein
VYGAVALLAAANRLLVDTVQMFDDVSVVGWFGMRCFEDSCALLDTVSPSRDTLEQQA